jgi:metal-responsive CopG/Arc/MetJ family transcriptional regulator
MPKTTNIGRPAGKGKFSGKLIHIRLPDDLANELDRIVDERIDGVTASAVIREALAQYVHGRRAQAHGKPK